MSLRVFVNPGPGLDFIVFSSILLVTKVSITQIVHQHNLVTTIYIQLVSV